ncbi:MAG: peptidoglycan-binding protein [Candidatus Absconditabacterales bacterium]|nr:peptidoglycan-binding protein [Candidatus Absconditabacterales bacterium]
MIEQLENVIDKDYRSIDKDSELADTVKGVTQETEMLANDVIENLNLEKRSSTVEEELQQDGAWLTYGEMKAKNTYTILVQSSISLVSDKLTQNIPMLANSELEMKFDKNGKQDTNGKTLKEMLAEAGGIDNVYGGGTHKLVKMVQSIFGIHADGLAGPQYFANVNAFLQGKSLDRFGVKGINDYVYSDISEHVFVKEKIVTNVNEIPKEIKYFQYDKYIYVAGGAKYIFYKEGGKVEKHSKNRETPEITISKLTSDQVKEELGITIEQKNSLDLKDIDIFDISKDPMKTIFETVKQKDPLNSNIIYPVRKDDNKITFISQSNPSSNKYVVLEYDYNDKNVTVGQNKYLAYIFLTESSEMDLPSSDLYEIWGYKHELFVALANKYTEIWRKYDGTGMYNKEMKTKAIEEAWPGLKNLVGKRDARDVTEWITNKPNGKKYRKWAEDQSKLGNTHTTLKDWLIYREVFSS